MSRRKNIFLALALMTAGLWWGCGDDTQQPGDPPTDDKPTDDKPVALTAEDVKLENGENLVTSETGTTATFSIALNKNPATEVTFQITTSNVLEGTVAPTTLTFNADNWETPQNITITGVDDKALDGDVKYNVILSYMGDTSTTSGDSTSIEALFKKEISVTNQDDDKAAFTVEPLTGLETSEDGTTAQFSVVLNVKPTNDVKLSLSSSNEKEGTLETKELTFTPDNWNQPQTVTVTGVDDDASDGKQEYSVEVKVSSGDEAFKSLEPQSVQVTNNDNDSAGIKIVANNDLSTAEDGSTATFSVSLVTQPLADVTLTVESDNIAEGIPSPTKLTFTPDNWNKDQQVTVTGVADDLIDGNITYHITVGKAETEDVAYAAVESKTIEITNIDKSVAGVIYSPNEIMTNEEGTIALVSFVLTAKPTANVKFTLQSDTPDEGIVGEDNNGVIEFTPDNWNIPQEVPVKGINDLDIDENQNYNIVLSNAESSDPNYNEKFGVNIPAINVDNDKPGITVSKASELLEVGEDGSTGTFSIMLNNQPKATVTIEFEVTQDYVSADNTVLTFTPEDWNVSQTVTLTGTDDFFAEGDKEFEIAFVSTTCDGDENYNKIQGLLASIKGILRDNDVAGIKFGVPDGELKTSESGTKLPFSITLTAQPRQVVTAELFVSDETEAAFVTTTLEFNEENWNTPQIIELAGVDDDIIDGDVEFEISAKLTSEDTHFHEIETEPLKIINVDDEVAAIHVEPTEIVLTKGMKDASFSVSLSGAPLTSFEVVLECKECDGYAILSENRIKFTPEDWDAKTISIKPIKFNEKPTDYTIQLKPVEGEVLGYQGVDPDDVKLTMLVFETRDFEFTGNPEKLTLYPGKYKLEVWGAQGGGNMQWPGGAGGYSVGTLNLKDTSDVYVYVGGAGTIEVSKTYTCGEISATNCSSSSTLLSLIKGGYNGGGDTQTTAGAVEGSGGGGTDIRFGGDTFYHRIIVAGGGGGAQVYYGQAASHGGGVEGGGYAGNSSEIVRDRIDNNGNGGPGTQTSGGNAELYPTYDLPNYNASPRVGDSRPGTFGLGGQYYAFHENNTSAGGGGGGWYGGGVNCHGGGGGGSGYVLTEKSYKPVGYMLDSKYYLSEAEMIPGNESFTAPDGSSETGHTGNGYARISMIMD